MKRMLLPKRRGVTGSWRKLHNEELHNLYASKYYWKDQVKWTEMDGTCSAHERADKCIHSIGRRV
jgi:hypothetical protein